MTSPQRYAPALGLTGRVAIAMDGGHGIGRDARQRMARSKRRVVVVKIDAAAGEIPRSYAITGQTLLVSRYAAQ